MRGACDSLVGRGADVDAPRLAPRFKLAGQRHVVPKQAVSGHFNAHHARQDRPGVDADSQLRGRVGGETQRDQ